MSERLVASGASTSVEGQANRGLAEVHVRWPDAELPVKVQIARMSAFHLEPPIATADGLPVASFRDVVAGQLHALRDRTMVRDVIDLHAILFRPPATGMPGPADVATRVLEHAADLHQSDPGLSLPQLAQAIARGQRAASLSQFPLRLLVPISDAMLGDTCAMALSVLESAITERLSAADRSVGDS